MPSDWHMRNAPPASILNSHVVSLPLQSLIPVANFCAVIDTLIDQDAQLPTPSLTKIDIACGV